MFEFSFGFNLVGLFKWLENVHELHDKLLFIYNKWFDFGEQSIYPLSITYSRVYSTCFT